MRSDGALAGGGPEGVGVGVEVGVRVGVSDGVAVGVGVRVKVEVKIGEDAAHGVSGKVLEVSEAMGVAVGGTGVEVGVLVAVGGTGVGVRGIGVEVTSPPSLIPLL